MFSPVLVSGSVKGRCHGNHFQARNRPKSATCLPSCDSHSKTDGSMEKPMGALTAQIPSSTSYTNLVNFGAPTPEFTVMVWRSFIRQMGEIGETSSIRGNRIPQRMAGAAERICAKFMHTEDVFGPSFMRV